jgi:hypothetical protein
MITTLKTIFAGIFLCLCCVVLLPELGQSTFGGVRYLAGIPWASGTLLDFYVNTFIIGVWALYKERSVWMGIGWIVLFGILGNVASSAFVLLQLFLLGPGEGVRDLVLRTAGAGSPFRISR